MSLKTNVVDAFNKKSARVQDEGALEVIASNIPVFGEKQKRIEYRDFFRDVNGSEVMGVNGSLASPIDFVINANNTNADRYISTISFEIVDAGATLNQFGNIGVLTNGVQLIYSNPEAPNGLVSIDIEGLKTNWDFVRLCQGNPPFGSGTSAFRASNVIGNSEGFIPILDIPKAFGVANGIRLRANTTDQIIIRVRDNLTGVDRFTAIGTGFDRLSIA